LAGAIFLTVGWIAMAPDDPQGAISILARRGAAAMLLQAAGLAAITAALATVIVGRRLPQVGTFAAAIGLTAVSLRGESTVFLLLQYSPAQSQLAGKFAFEAILWSGVLMIAAVISELITRWLAPASIQQSDSSSSAERRQGWQHTILLTGAGLAAFYLFGGALSSRAVQHGQACFLIAASVAVGAYLAHRLAPVRSPAPSLAAAAILTLVGYVWTWWRPGAAGLPANVPVSPFLRVLPIQMIAVGVAAAIGMFWYMAPYEHEPRPSEDAR
jgi:hypothetical protein